MFEHASSQRSARSFVIVVIDGRGAIVDRCEDGRLARLHTLDITPRHGDADHMGDAPVPHYHAGTRGTTASAAAQAARRAACQRLIRAALPLVASSAHGDEWILIGGRLDLVNALSQTVPAHVAARVILVRNLRRKLSAAEIVRRSVAAVEASQRATNAEAVQALLERTGAHTTGVVGIMATLDAIEHGAAEVVYVTDSFVAHHARDARQAIEGVGAQGGRVEYVDGEPGMHLDADAGGIGATLRFALHASVARR